MKVRVGLPVVGSPADDDEDTLQEDIVQDVKAPNGVPKVVGAEAEAWLLSNTNRNMYLVECIIASNCSKSCV